MAASSMLLSSLTPSTAHLHPHPHPHPQALFSSPSPSPSFFSLPTSTTQQPNSISFPLARRFEPISSRFVRYVAVSSEYGYEQEQEQEQEGVVEDDRQFSPDLKLFVGNLPFNVDSAGLAGLFGSAGTVEMVEVIYDKFTGRSRGFGFVTMSSAEEAEAAAQQFNGYELNGRQIRVNSGPPPPRDSAPRIPRGGSSSDNSYRVHVGNLSWKVDDAALESLFSDQGDVLEAKVIYDRDSGRSRGFGFVTFGSAEEVNNAIESLDGLDFNGRSIRVTQAEARPRRQF